MKIPDYLLHPQWQPLCAVHFLVAAPHLIGETPLGSRRVAHFIGGTFQSERLQGEVVDGRDWLTVRSDGVWVLDVRALLRTDDGVLLGLNYRGFRHGPAEVLARIARGEKVGPEEYYFRISALFEAPPGKYDYLNRLLTIGIGHRLSDGPVYNLFEVL